MDRYRRVKDLGSGAQGVVFKAEVLKTPPSYEEDSKTDDKG